MNTPKDKLIATLDELIRQCAEINRQRTKDGSYDPAAYWQVRASAQNLIRLLGSVGQQWDRIFNPNPEIPLPDLFPHVQKMLGTLVAIKEALVHDLLVTVEELFLAETFSDLLEQADYLLETNYVLPAGVIGRAVLEEHLRKWCAVAGCAPAKPKATMSDYYGELYRAKHLNKLELKKVESMAAVGNEAAHKGTVTKQDVEHLLRDLRDFIASHPIR